ncbi:MAG: hypothetical protein P8N76_17900 [Pirellulaceae bacterium]|nr:hypothetical protein [Pirellulaceae bacterium]
MPIGLRDPGGMGLSTDYFVAFKRPVWCEDLAELAAMKDAFYRFPIFQWIDVGADFYEIMSLCKYGTEKTGPDFRGCAHAMKIAAESI